MSDSYYHRLPNNQRRQQESGYYQQDDNNISRYHHQQYHHQQQQQQGPRHHSYQQLHEHSDAKSPPLPPGWVEATDPDSGRIYFANPSTQETRWDRPYQPTAPPSQPPQQQLSAWNDQARTTASVGPSKGFAAGENVRSSSIDANTSIVTTNQAIVHHHPRHAPHHPQSDQIVKLAREMIEQVQAFPEQALDKDLELRALTPGQVADLCKLQHRIHSHQQQQQQHGYQEDPSSRSAPLPPYTPINPFTMPMRVDATLEEKTEPGRLDVRMNLLRRKLQEFGYQPHPSQQRHPP